MAVVVLFHFVFNPFYESMVDPISVWHVLNWVMAVGVIIALVLTYMRRERLGPESTTTISICVNVAFYASLVLAILFFWNWFDDLTVRRRRSEPDSRVLLGGHKYDVRRAAGHDQPAPVEGWWSGLVLVRLVLKEPDTLESLDSRTCRRSEQIQAESMRIDRSTRP